MEKEEVFEVRAISDEEMKNFIKESVDEYRKYVETVIDRVENVNDRAVKLRCYFLLIESIAQDVANYPIGQQQKTFVDFVLKHQSLYSYLENVDPVTLFYHVEEKIDKKFDLHDFVDGGVYEPKDTFIRNQANIIKDVLSNIIRRKKCG